jgi:hypothetical protein
MIYKVLAFIPIYCAWVGAASYAIFGLCTACLEPGLLQLVSILGYLVVIMIPVVAFILWLNAKPGWAKQVEANGKSATATILSVKETGLVINNTVAVVKLQLRVEPLNEAPFEVSQEKEISMITGLGGYSVGAHLKVKYDPDHKDHLVILSEADPSPAPSLDPAPKPDVAQQLQELAHLHKSGELSDSEYTAAKKKLLG